MIAIGTKVPYKSITIPVKKVGQSNFERNLLLLDFVFTEWNYVWEEQMSFYNDALKHYNNCKNDIDGISVVGRLVLFRN